MNILIDGPKTINFQPQHLATVLDCLAQAPYRVAKPIMDSIFQQIQEKPKKEVAVDDGQGSDRVAP